MKLVDVPRHPWILHHLAAAAARHASVSSSSNHGNGTGNGNGNGHNVSSFANSTSSSIKKH